MAYLYHDYVRNLDKRVRATLATIAAHHNFEFGDEFEIALCQLLRAVLPDRYGICRGYVVSSDGTAKGDDIIIFDRSRFPVLHLRGRDDFSRKEYVPSEATYAYIEAKYTLHLYGTGPQSITKAVRQVADVKQLLSQREAVDPGQLNRHWSTSSALNVTMPAHLPKLRNPPFGAVFAAGGRIKQKGARTQDPSVLRPALTKCDVGDINPPDLIVVGDNVVVAPVLTGPALGTAFYVPGESAHQMFQVPGTAFAVALTSLLAALDWIDLGSMPWYRIVADALGVGSTK